MDLAESICDTTDANDKRKTNRIWRLFHMVQALQRLSATDLIHYVHLPRLVPRKNTTEHVGHWRGESDVQ